MFFGGLSMAAKTLSPPMPTPTDPVALEAWLQESLDEKDAAAFLGVEPQYLARRRSEGDSPKYRKFSYKTILYVRRDLIEWRDGKAFSSTAEYQRPVASTSTVADD